MTELRSKASETRDPFHKIYLQEFGPNQNWDFKLTLNQIMYLPVFVSPAVLSMEVGGKKKNE